MTSTIVLLFQTDKGIYTRPKYAQITRTVQSPCFVFKCFDCHGRILSVILSDYCNYVDDHCTI